MNRLDVQPKVTSPTGASGYAGARGFTLIELLVVVALIAILAGLLLPALSGAKERARLTKVRAELYGVGLALEMYADDHAGRLPPVRVNCNSDLADHWCQFPVELADLGYLPRGERPGMAACMEDVFNPGHTYKYATLGPQLLNDTPAGDFKLWVPADFPDGRDTNGSWQSGLERAPVRWVVWSLGPRPDSARSQSGQAPLAASTWYRRGAGGVILRLATREGVQRQFP